MFVDPPYTVMHNNNFVKYNANLFSWTDQIRLASAVKRAARRGAALMISNADHRSVRELYADSALIIVSIALVFSLPICFTGAESRNCSSRVIGSGRAGGAPSPHEQLFSRF